MTELGFRAYFRWVAERNDEFSLLFGGGARTNADFSAHIERLTDQIAEAIAPMIDVEIDSQQRDMLAHGLMGMAESASRYLINRGEPFDPDATADALSHLAWAGLRSVNSVTSDAI